MPIELPIVLPIELPIELPIDLSPNKYFFQKEFCREGAYLRGFVITKGTFSQKSFAAKVPI